MPRFADTHGRPSLFGTETEEWTRGGVAEGRWKEGMKERREEQVRLACKVNKSIKF